MDTLFRTLGGWFIGEDRPEDKIKIDFFIPKEKGDAYLENDTVMPVEYADNRVTDMPNAPMLRPENLQPIYQLVLWTIQEPSLLMQ